MSAGRQRPAVTPFVAGLRCRCPNCGDGPLYDGFLTVAKTCRVCGFDLQKADSGDGPAVILIFFLGALVVPLALLVESLFGPPLWFHAVVWPVVILALALGALRPMKSLLIALQFRNKASEGGSVDYDA